MSIVLIRSLCRQHRFIRQVPVVQKLRVNFSRQVVK